MCLPSIYLPKPLLTSSLFLNLLLMTPCHLILCLPTVLLSLKISATVLRHSSIPRNTPCHSYVCFAPIPLLFSHPFSGTCRSSLISALFQMLQELYGTILISRFVSSHQEAAINMPWSLVRFTRSFDKNSHGPHCTQSCKMRNKNFIVVVEWLLPLEEIHQILGTQSNVWMVMWFSLSDRERL